MADDQMLKGQQEIDPAVSDTGFPVPVPQGDTTQLGSGISLPTEHLNRRSPEVFVRQFIDMRGLEVRFDGSLVVTGRPVIALTQSMVDEVLATDRLDASNLIDQMTIYAKTHGYLFKRGDLAAAMREVVRVDQKQRHNTVIRPLLVDYLTEDEECRAKQQWDEIGKLFEMEGSLAVAILQHFIWQILQKPLGRPVTHHLMPIVFSSVQGSGKTTFVKKFLGPLKELASDAALLSDFADRRSGDIYRYPAVLMDDLEKVPSSMVPILKSVLTAPRIRRRQLGSSFTTGIAQNTTLIGTANAPINQLIEDETGHRRFATLPFRNGQVTKGGEDDVWKIVESVDYDLLWRSVKAFQPSPIEAHLAALMQHQGVGQLESPLIRWLNNLNLQSEEVLRITTRHGIRAQGLHNLYVVKTDANISQPRFAEEMQRYLLRPDARFADKIKVESGILYRLRSTSGNPADPSSPSVTANSAASGSTGPADASGSTGPADASDPTGRALTSPPSQPNAAPITLVSPGL